MAEHGQAVSGAISDTVERLVRAQGGASDAADAVASAAEDYGADSPEVEEAIGAWLNALGALTQNYQGLLKQFQGGQAQPSVMPRGPKLPVATDGMPPGAMVLARRSAPGSGAAPLSYDPEEKAAPRPSFVPPWPAGSAHAPTSTARRAPQPMRIIPFRGLGRSPLLNRY